MPPRWIQVTGEGKDKREEKVEKRKNSGWVGRERPVALCDLAFTSSGHELVDAQAGAACPPLSDPYVDNW